MMTKFYQHILSLAFAVNEVNKNPNILPNFTLGFHIYDSYNDAQMTYRTTMKLLFNSHRFVPNYECDTLKKLIAVIGALAFDTSLNMAYILNPYKIPQLTYGSFAPVVSEMRKLPSFFHMVPNEAYQYNGIISLLKHFGWMLVGLFVVDDDQGDRFLQAVGPLLSNNGICVDFTKLIPNEIHFSSRDIRTDLADNIYQLINFRKSRIFVIYGETSVMMYIWYFTIDLGGIGHEQSILRAKVWIITAQIDFIISTLLRNSDLHVFHGAIAFSIHSNEPLGFQKYLQILKPTWRQADDFLEEFWEQAFDCSAPDPLVPYKVSGRCTGEEKLETLPGPFFEMRMTGHSYGIYNAVYAVAHALHALYSSRFNHRGTLHGKQDELQDLKPWQVLPISVCSDSCQPGYQKIMKEGEKFCCYDCNPCPEGKISNQTVLVLQTFIKHRDTPIVKANNRGLTYTLLISLLLCFLSSFLFIGQPGKLNCFLQQPVIGLIFSVAVSSVLAKTITVVVAFMATKPGSNMRKWVGKRLATSIVLSCSLIQAGICALWLTMSPPFPDLDMHSVPEEITVRCNAGSAIIFSFLLGYMGLLSVISFWVAFLARKLPDSFNEAKFITFSMLTFCSVWLSFVPAYLSTKGKYMVAVEIFSILASSAGLLGCIFSPKCYIILFKPELNSREQLIRKKN
ncbi:vomeronasal type-2 receptor 26-like [Elgaria multicarinata webbii]|uniref:vomeronasal type-2 receptor 26-like n=1 Tax=Elgaria multicarinata webbii TaxID=159646 RepID=UPI002FCD414E